MNRKDTEPKEQPKKPTSNPPSPVKPIPKTKEPQASSNPTPNPVKIIMATEPKKNHHKG